MADKIDWNDLILEKTYIGYGSYGDVYKAIWKTKDGLSNVAVKRLRDSIDETKIQIEVGYLSLAKHENIVALYGTTKDDDNRTIMLMEYADCGSLHDILHKKANQKPNTQYIPYNFKINWMLQCAKGIGYLHELNPKILHRDVKSQNLLLFNHYKILKICDFGTVKQLATKMTNEVGTPQYMAPEVNDEVSYTEKCDVFSFGITFWEVMSGKMPFYDLDAVALTIQIKIVNGDRPEISDIQDFNDSDFNNKQITKLIEECWHKDSNMRPTMKQVIKKLGSLYIKLQVEKKLFNGEALDVKEISDVLEEDLILEGSNMFDIVKWNDIALEKPAIGFGKFGDVYKAKLKTNDGEKTIVAKWYKYPYFSGQNSGKELNPLSRLKHENIMMFYGVSLDDDNRHVLLEEYADCGSLFNVLHGNENKTNYTGFEGLKWMHQCVKGMAYMHSQNVIHRNLKPENLLLMNKFQTLKVSILGIMFEANALISNPYAGIPAYLAPEVARGSKYTEKSDVYSFGIILWETMSGKRPYYPKTESLEIFKEVLENDYRPNLKDANILMSSTEILELIEKCWHSDPDKRPTMNDLQWHIGNILLSS